MQLLPACLQSIFILSIIKPTAIIKAQTLDFQARAIIGLGFLFFFLPTEIEKKQKTQPGTTEGSGTQNYSYVPCVTHLGIKSFLTMQVYTIGGGTTLYSTDKT